MVVVPEPVGTSLPFPTDIAILEFLPRMSKGPESKPWRIHHFSGSIGEVEMVGVKEAEGHGHRC